MISGRTTLIAHLGYPTEAFKAPMIYNPYFEKAGIDAVVMPMGVKAADYPDLPSGVVQRHQHPWRAGDDAAQEDHDRACRRSEPDRTNCRRGQRPVETGGRNPARGHVRRRGLRPGRTSQGTQAEPRQRTGHRFRWCRVGHRGVAGGRGRDADGSGRRGGRGGRFARQSAVRRTTPNSTSRPGLPIPPATTSS